MEKKSFRSRRTLAGFLESKRLASLVTRGRVIIRQRGVDKYKPHVLIAVETLLVHYLKSSQRMTLLVVDDDGNEKFNVFKERRVGEKDMKRRRS